MTEAGESHEAARLAKLHAIEALGIDPWGARFDGHMPVASVRALPVNPEAPAPARIAGRVVLRRVMGNVHFLHVQDSTGRVQVMLGKKQIGELGWKLAQELDLGDLVGVDGGFGTTKTGELTVLEIGTVVALRDEISGETIISTSPSCVMNGVTRRMMPTF